jgi:hypothetical protein
MRHLPPAASLLAALVLAACGGGGSDTPTPPPQPPVVSDYSVSGTLSGLPVGNTIALTLNGGTPLSLSADGSFAFSARLSDGAAYQAVVLTQPNGAVCDVANGAGTVAKANVNNLLVSCLVPAPPPPTVADYSVGGQVSGLPASEKLVVTLNGGNALEVSANAGFSFAGRVNNGSAFNVKIAQQPASAYCVVARGVGAVQASDIADIAVRCSTTTADPSAALLDNSQLHRLRLTISADEWQAFVLNTERSRYDQDAFGHGDWSLWSISEVYRRGTLEYLDAKGSLIKAMPDVGFRMRGNTSRQWPEVWTQDSGSGQWYGRPRRFHINLKFDEDFSGDESAYACIDSAGMPAAVNGAPCESRVADDIAPVPANKDRTFMGLESLALKFNKDDPSYLREALAYAVLNDRGVPSGRAVHATLELVITAGSRVSSLFGRALPQTYQMGVYTLVEPVDKLFVQRRFGKNGYLFKVGGGDLSSNDPDACVSFDTRGSTNVSSSFCRIGLEQPDPLSRVEWIGAAKANDAAHVNSDINDAGGQSSQFKPYLPNYDLKTKKTSLAAGRTELKKFIALVSNPASSLAQLEAVFDVEGFIKAQAVDIAIGAVDHYARVANNYYLYQNPDTKKWSYIPYDYDFAFRDTHIASWPENPPFRNVASATAFSGSNNWRAVRIDGVNPRLYDLVFSSTTNQNKLLAELASLRAQWFDWAGRTGPLLEQWLARVEPAIALTNAAEPDSGDTQYKRAAATGDSYTYSSWVNESNPLATQRGGPYPGNATAPSIQASDTIKRFISTRNTALAAEAK